MANSVGKADDGKTKDMFNEEDSDEEDGDASGEEMSGDAGSSGGNQDNDSSDDEDSDDSGDEDNEDDDDDDTDNDGDDTDEEKYLTEAENIENHLLDNPYDYDQCIKLIEVTGKLTDIRKIRKARKDMSTKFPMSPDLWLEWIEKERIAIGEDGDESYFIELFEKALKDYVSVKLWLEYIYFMDMQPREETNVKRVRELFERAINSVGLHVTQGSKIWAAYRTYECVIIELIDQNERVNQYKRILDLYKRQLSIPLMMAGESADDSDSQSPYPSENFDEPLKGMRETLEEFNCWYETTAKKQCPGLDIDPNCFKFAYEQACELLLRLVPFEKELIRSEAPHYQAYLKYIEFEEVNGTPPRVQCIYERALLENCLETDLWIKYTRYFDNKVQDLELVTAIHERAVRNCPWTVSVWINYLRSLERNKASHEVVLAAFQRSIEITYASGKDYLDLWLTYLDYLRRQTDWTNDALVAQLRQNFGTAIQHLSSFADGDFYCTVPIYMAMIEAKYLNNMGEARRIWNELFQSRKDLAANVSTWIDFANFERLYGDAAHYKNVLIKGLNSNVDAPENLGALLIKFVREESQSISEIDETMSIYEKAMTKVSARREKAAIKQLEEKAARAARKKESGKQPSSEDKGLFKVPEPPRKSNEGDKGKHKMSANAVRDEKILAEMKRQAELKRKDDGENDLNTIFVSNLKYSVSEENLREVFSQFGEITDIRLVRNYKGQFHGYGYIEFASMGSVKSALKHDRLLVEDRPCFISEKGKRHDIKYANSREGNKLFVSGLDRQVTKEQLTAIFEQFGVLKDVRIATLKSGKSKGYAYIEFRDERDANVALKADGELLNDRRIKVQISDPSARSKQDNHPRILGSGSLQQSTSTISAKRKIDVPFIPPSVRKKMKAEQSTSPSPSTTTNSVNPDKGDDLPSLSPSTAKDV